MASVTSPRKLRLDPFRVGKAYTAAQAARLARTSPGTIHNWMLGYETETYSMPAVLGPKEAPGNERFTVSFLELAELIIVAKYRKWKIDLAVIRDAHQFALREWHLPYPFATLNMLTLGGHVLARYQREAQLDMKLVVMDKPEQYVLPGIVQEQVERFDFDNDSRDPFAERWYPYGKSVPIVVDPHYGGGMMTIRGRGITVEALKRRAAAGETYESIAGDYDLKVPLVREVLQLVA